MARVRTHLLLAGPLLGALLLTMVAPACTGGDDEGGDAGGLHADAAEIYAAVIDRLYRIDSSFGAVPEFDRIYVRSTVGGPRPSLEPDPTGDEAVLLPLQVQADIVEQLGDLPTLEFLDDPDAVVDPQSEGGRVRDNGVLVRLGAIAEVDGAVEVPAALYVSPEGGVSLSYRLDQVGGAWEVAGLSDTTAVS